MGIRAEIKGRLRLLQCMGVFAVLASMFTAHAAFATLVAADSWLQERTRSWGSIDPEVRDHFEKNSSKYYRPKKEMLFEEPEVLNRIQSVIDRIVQAPLNQELFLDLEIKFYVFKTNSIRISSSSIEKNKGVIWIHGRILLSLQSESEFAALVAHEIGHILARDSLAEMHLKQKGYIREVMRDLRQRHRETECDLMSSHLMANAGYDPRGIISALTRLDTRDAGSCPGLLTRVRSVLDSHPLTYERNQNVEKHLREYPQLNQSERMPERSWEEWRNALAPYATLFF